MRAREDFRSAVAVTAVGTGLGFASGRTQAVFCAQTVHASWLGAVFSALAYGLLMAMLCHLKRRTGARRLPGVYRRLLGCHAGKLIGGLYAVALLVAAALLLSAAAKVGALVLPLRRAALTGALTALLIAGIVAALGDGALTCVGGAYLTLLLMHKTLGGWQFGARYTVDMLPMALMYLLLKKDEPGGISAFIMAAGMMFNLYGALAMTMLH